MAGAKGLVAAGGLVEGTAGVVEPKVGALPQAVAVGVAAEANGFENGEVDFGASGAPKMLVGCSGARTELVNGRDHECETWLAIVSLQREESSTFGRTGKVAPKPAERLAERRRSLRVHQRRLGRSSRH